MESGNTYNLFISLLLMAVTLSYGFPNADSGQQFPACKHIHQSAIATDLPAEINIPNQDSTMPLSSATATYSCSMSMQMIPVERQSLYPLQDSNILISAHNNVLFSQSFVFQEPDPPQLG